MMNRCHNPKDKSFERYGAKGIKVCKRWHNFENFLQDMGKFISNAPTDISMDRIDNTGNYEPSNVRMATREEQANNTKLNIFVKHDGLRLSVAEWAKRAGLKYYTLYKRLDYGWPFEIAVRAPVGSKLRDFAKP